MKVRLNPIIKRELALGSFDHDRPHIQHSQNIYIYIYIHTHIKLLVPLNDIGDFSCIRKKGQHTDTGLSFWYISTPMP